jgi:hypothetical protein
MLMRNLREWAHSFRTKPNRSEPRVSGLGNSRNLKIVQLGAQQPEGSFSHEVIQTDR